MAAFTPSITFPSIWTRVLFHCLSSLAPLFTSLILSLDPPSHPEIRLSPLILLKRSSTLIPSNIFSNFSRPLHPQIPQREFTGAAAASVQPIHSLTSQKLASAPPLHWATFLKVNHDLQSNNLFTLPNLPAKRRQKFVKGHQSPPS